MINILGHRVLIKPQPLEEVDEAYAAAKRMGFEIPDKDMKLNRNAVSRGHVVQVGQTAYNDFGGVHWCNVGDEVFYVRYSGSNLTDPYTKEEYVALNDEDVLAVIGEE